MNRQLIGFLLCVVFVLTLGVMPAQAQKKKKVKEVIPVPVRSITIAPVDGNQEKQIIRSSRMIDSLVEANYRKQGIEPNEMATDEQFIRRTYLNIVGAVPKFKQARVFIRSGSKDKRKKVIDKLLEDPGYASHNYNYWADILRVSDRITNNVPGRPYAEWVKQSIEENKPYDQFVYEMLSAEGKIYDNPAAGYILRDSGMPLDAVNNTVRVFLGTQIGCAQCHDHPFDRWTQKEFYQMAAYSYGALTNRSARDKMFGGKNIVAKMREELKSVDEKFDGGGKYNRFLNANLREVFDVKRNLVLPHDYQYDNAKPKQKMEPHAIFDPQPVVKAGDSPRVVIAKWMTSRENPRFTKTIVNRLWKRAFGLGLIEPVDDMRDDTVATNPELLDFLISEMHRLDFDMKEFMRIIYNTKTFQRQATFVEVEMGTDYHFPGPILRRMSPEQIWDSFITIAVTPPEEYQREPAAIQSNLLNIDLTSVTAEEIYQRDVELRRVTSGKFRNARDKSYKHQGLLLVRASELPQPVPPAHFLRQFGQSDRETIQGNFNGGSVPQILQMFNGPLTHLLLHEKSNLVFNVQAQKKDKDRADAIFLSILSRYPSDEEREIALAEFRANGSAGYGNVVWSLVNTREFLFIQ
ncbi:MAG: DUF1549 domain-containing protein [Planctomycetaceae bacterium]|nr:DUF1549 domain-containing protein [Planctomycetaceae bacterium]